MSGRRWLAAMAALLAAAAAACGLGPGDRSAGEATLTVTRDYGSERLLSASAESPSESETVIRMLDREAEITTRYGGGFVQSIDGVAGGVEGGRSVDWFFFVNGIESDRGAAEVPVRGGDRIWWDRRDWTDALRTPAVVGSWPEPFAQASVEEEDRLPVVVECAGPRLACDAVLGELLDLGVSAEVERFGRAGRAGEDALRLLVGSWARIDEDPVAELLERGPATSGVFARFDRTSDERISLEALDERAAVAHRSPRAGLIAALRRGEDPVTWVITGTHDPAVAAAARALEDTPLESRYAVAVTAAGTLRLPVVGEP